MDQGIDESLMNFLDSVDENANHNIETSKTSNERKKRNHKKKKQNQNDNNKSRDELKKENEELQRNIIKMYNEINTIRNLFKKLNPNKKFPEDLEKNYQLVSQQYKILISA